MGTLGRIPNRDIGVQICPFVAAEVKPGCRVDLVVTVDRGTLPAKQRLDRGGYVADKRRSVPFAQLSRGREVLGLIHQVEEHLALLREALSYLRVVEFHVVLLVMGCMRLSSRGWVHVVEKFDHKFVEPGRFFHVWHMP